MIMNVGRFPHRLNRCINLRFHNYHYKYLSTLLNIRQKIIKPQLKHQYAIYHSSSDGEKIFFDSYKSFPILKSVDSKNTGLRTTDVCELLYRMQNLKNDRQEVGIFLRKLSNKLLKTNDDDLITSKDIGNALFGLQNMSIANEVGKHSNISYYISLSLFVRKFYFCF